MKKNIILLSVVGFILSMLGMTFHQGTLTASADITAIYPDAAAALVNEYRAENGLPPLKAAPVMFELSDLRAKELLVSYGHDRPDGSDWFTVVEQSSLDANCNAFENIAAGFRTPQDVVAAWVNSEAHREAMLSDAVEYIGIGYAYDPDDPYHCYHYWELLEVSSAVPLADAYEPVLMMPETTTTTTTTVPKRTIIWTEEPVETTTQTTTTTTTTTQPVTEPVIQLANPNAQDEALYKIGDLDNNNVIDVTDCVALQRLLLGQTSFNDCVLHRADCFEDGFLDQRDMLVLMRYLVGTVHELPV